MSVNDPFCICGYRCSAHSLSALPEARYCPHPGEHCHVFTESEGLNRPQPKGRRETAPLFTEEAA